jgi:hypothetical protein
MKVTEVDTVQAGRALGMTRQAVRAHVVAGRLSARRKGVRGHYFMTLEALREFATLYRYDLDEAYLTTLME